MSAAAMCKPHRFGDPINPANCDIHDAARGLLVAVATLDRLGIVVLSVETDRLRNQRVLVEYCKACDTLGGVECQRFRGLSTWTANRYGIEIRWMRPSSGEAS